MEKPRGPSESSNLDSIVDLIRPTIEALVADGQGDDPDCLMEKAVRANVEASVRRLRDSSEIISRLERDDGLVIAGAEYSLDTGLVEFFDSAD